jgi:hypothetical protein
MDHSIDLILRDARGIERVRYENVTESARTAAPRAAAAAEPVPVKAASVR